MHGIELVAPKPEEPPDNRAYERVQLRIRGRIFDPLTEDALECLVLNISSNGAGIECTKAFPPGAKLILYIEAFGRFEGAVIPHKNFPPEGEIRFGMAFITSEQKRRRIAQLLTLFVRGGLKSVTDVRAARRIRTDGFVEVELQNGRKLPCELIDISVEGVSLRITKRLQIGEIVHLGKTPAEVVRQHEFGVALRFLRDIPDPRAT